MNAGPRLPPLDALHRVTSLLASASIPHALGGSALLAALGLELNVRDWDLTTDESVDRVQPVIADLPHSLIGPNGPYETQGMFRISVCGASIDLMCRFALRTPSGVVRIPTLPGEVWNGVPLAGPLAWAVAYDLLDRTDKARSLWQFLKTRGAPHSHRHELLSQPLPRVVRDRIERLPRLQSNSP